MSKRFKVNHLGFHFPFDVYMCTCPCLHVSMSPYLHVFMSPCPCLHVFMSPCPCLRVFWTPLEENGNLCCERKTETANFRLFAANEQKRKVVFLGRQMINGNQRLLFQKMCPSVSTSYPICSYLHSALDNWTGPSSNISPSPGLPVTWGKFLCLTIYLMM